MLRRVGRTRLRRSPTPRPATVPGALRGCVGSRWFGGDGYHWWVTSLAGHPGFLASGYGGQIIGVVPSLDLVVDIKYEAEAPVHPKAGTAHDDMHLFELVVQAVR